MKQGGTALYNVLSRAFFYVLEVMRVAIKICRVDKQDLEKFLKLQKETFLKNGDTAGPINETMTHILRDYETTDLYKVMLDDKMIGGCSIAHKGESTYRIHRLFIDPVYQNHHYGRDVMLEIMKTYNWNVIQLDTPKHQLRNRHFYKSLGFQEMFEKDVGDHYILIEFELRRN